ncbi:MAG TPA: DUF1579 family protein [Steroidobacteraceae bacterium]|nr:DUF1579 family protein [Steroidobacteraceae bacterium]
MKRYRKTHLMAGCLLPLFSLVTMRSGSGAVPPLLHAMAGTWDVKEWMWTGPGTQPIDLPAAVAHRRLIGGKFLQEVMTALPGTAAAFSRIAYFDYNAMSGQYEYASIDTRAPQIMNERSNGPAAADDAIPLYGGIFVADHWGAAANVPFRYRLVVGPLHKDAQTVELYLTPMPAAGGKGFLAFKYLYTRRANATPLPSPGSHRRRPAN